MSSQWLAVAWGCAAAAGSLLGKHFPPDDQLTHALLGRQWQQAVVLAVQAHIQQVVFRQMVGDQVRLGGGESFNDFVNHQLTCVEVYRQHAFYLCLHSSSDIFLQI